jgi:hypothetical protein
MTLSQPFISALFYEGSTRERPRGRKVAGLGNFQTVGGIMIYFEFNMAPKQCGGSDAFPHDFGDEMPNFLQFMMGRKYLDNRMYQNPEHR